MADPKTDMLQARMLALIEKQRGGLEEPWIDPTAAFSGGFGAMIPSTLRSLAAKSGLKALAKPVISGIAGAISDYPLGLATEGVGKKLPGAELPFNIVAGMLGGAGIENTTRLMAKAGKARLQGLMPPMRSPLANEMGMVEAWHGSPHKFDKFSMEKIGTGEGAQAFGHGLYFTDKKAIAEHYANTLGGKRVSFEPGLEDEIGVTKEYLTKTAKNWLDYRRVNGGEFAQFADDKTISGKIVQAIEDGRIKEPRNIYKVTINKGKEDVWLDWDKTADRKTWHNIEAQFLQEGLGDAITAIKGRIKRLYAGKAEEATGAALYDSIADTIGIRKGVPQKDAQKEASLFLKRAGIDGIRYPTESLSGKKGSDKFNYVVFDEDAIDIDEAINF
jgi:hypothetical protein